MRHPAAWLFAAFFLAVALPCPGFGAEASTAPSDLPLSPVDAPEAFTYNVYVFGAHSGVARLEARATRTRVILHAVLTSAGLFHTVYPVANEALSVLDRATYVPGKAVMVTDEAHILSRYLMKFFPEQKKLQRIKTKHEQGRALAWRDFVWKGYGQVHDMLASLMYLRTRALQADETGTFMGFSGNYLYQVRYRVVERGKAYTELGLRDGVGVMASVRRWDERKNKPSKDNWSKEVKLWFSNDLHHVPLGIEVNLFVGAVKVVLAKIE